MTVTLTDVHAPFLSRLKESVVYLDEEIPEEERVDPYELQLAAQVGLV